jgi:hypothetical protein
MNAIICDMKAVEQAYTRIGSTGLYPYAVLEGARTFEAPQSHA